MSTLDTYRKKVEQLVRWHAERNHSVGERVRGLERFRSLTDREILALPFSLALAEEIVAVEAGHKNWSELEATAANAEPPPRPSARAPILKSVVPILFVRDVRASASFFREKLGFTINFLHGAPPFYGAVSRDGVCLHLRFVHEAIFVGAVVERERVIHASIEVSDVHALYEEFAARNVKFAEPLAEQPWGGTTFHIRDVDGNVISFVTFE